MGRFIGQMVPSNTKGNSFKTIEKDMERTFIGQELSILDSGGQTIHTVKASDSRQTVPLNTTESSRMDYQME